MASAYQELKGYQKSKVYAQLDLDARREFQREIAAESISELEARLDSVRALVAKTSTRLVNRVASLNYQVESIENIIEFRKKIGATRA